MVYWYDQYVRGQRRGLASLSDLNDRKCVWIFMGSTRELRGRTRCLIPVFWLYTNKHLYHHPSTVWNIRNEQKEKIENLNLNPSPDPDPRPATNKRCDSKQSRKNICMISTRIEDRRDWKWRKEERRGDREPQLVISESHRMLYPREHEKRKL